MEAVKGKIIKDCIYGHIEVPPLCVAFMDVPEFQRLRRVRQLGVAQYAYPSAVHTRFEHSLGVMHLAGTMVDQLRQSVAISDRTKVLIQLAGMYHDIGHFAFSHLFDSFLSRLPEDAEVPDIFRIKDHEERSVHFVRKVNERLKLLTLGEVEFVCDAIMGHVPHGQPSYLYEIVCNRACGVDVDKCDYLQRDAYHTGFPAFQSDYIIRNALVDAGQHIAFRLKARNDVADLFMTRQRMYERVYQHKTSLKMNKIHFCLMRRLGTDLYQFGERTDDYNIESLFRSHPDVVNLTEEALDNRKLRHDCETCREYQPVQSIKQSGRIEDVRFV
jgi:HD superfamily phosphohydrolase